MARQSDRDRPVRVVTAAGGAPMRRVPIALARRFLQVCAAVAAETLQPEDLGPLHFAVLAHASEEPGLDQVALASRIGIDRNSISLLLDHLERRGLVVRDVDETDRRARRISLTRAGAALHERLRPAMRAGQRAILTALPAAEREKFLDHLVLIVSAHAAYAKPGAARRKRRTARKE